MILRIKTVDFSPFAGYNNSQEDGEDFNKILDEYISVFKSNPLFILFYIEEDKSRRLYFDTICYIADKIGHKDELGRKIKMFTRTEKDDDGKPLKYYLCFTKEDKEDK